MTNLQDSLTKLGACEEALEWVADQSLATAWATCERGDWMLWILGRLVGPPNSKSRRRLVGTAADCAALALPIFERQYHGDKSMRECVQTCRRYAHGQANLTEVRKARYAVSCVKTAHANTTISAAAATISAAAAAIADAAISAADAAYHAAAAYADAATSDADAARKSTLKICADIVRGNYPSAPEIGLGE